MIEKNIMSSLDAVLLHVSFVTHRYQTTLKYFSSSNFFVVVYINANCCKLNRKLASKTNLLIAKSDSHSETIRYNFT